MKIESPRWCWLGWVHPAMPFLVWLPLALGSIGWGISRWGLSLEQVFLLALSALLSWSLLEYILHRWLFHPFQTGGILERLARSTHGKHHDQPDHPASALVPPVNAAIILIVLGGIFFLVLPVYALTVFMGFFILGYLFYEGVHLAIHHCKPKTRLGRFLRNHHLNHHKVESKGNFGVSSPLWDWLLGTWTHLKGRN